MVPTWMEAPEQNTEEGAKARVEACNEDCKGCAAESHGGRASPLTYRVHDLRGCRPHGWCKTEGMHDLLQGHTFTVPDLTGATLRWCKPEGYKPSSGQTWRGQTFAMTDLLGCNLNALEVGRFGLRGDCAVPLPFVCGVHRRGPTLSHWPV